MTRRWLLLAAVVASSCTVTKQARLYDVESAAVLQATYRSNGSGHGPIVIQACHGEYSTVTGGAIGWGQLYHSSGAVSQGFETSTDADARGQAVATCADGTVYECEYVTSAWTGAGHGVCRDNHAHRYRLMF